MSTRAGLIAGGMFGVLGAVICVPLIGHEDRHAPPTAVLTSDLSTLDAAVPFSSCIAAADESMPAEDEQPPVIVTFEVAAEIPERSPMPSASVEAGRTAGVEVRM